MTLTLITDVQRACPDARTDHALVHQARQWLAGAIAAGIETIQIREPALATSTLRLLAAGVVADTRGTSTQVLINSRADVALVTGADGVHLRDDGWPADRVRALSAVPWCIGRSVHQAPDGTPAGDGGRVDYVLFGAVFGSGGKPARGLDALRTLAASAPMPVIAVGGVTIETAVACAAAGAAGVAAIRLFLPAGVADGARGPGAAVRELRTVAGFSDTVTERPHE